MTSLLSKAVGFFVAPAEPPAQFAPPRPRLAVAGVLAAEADLLVAAGAVAGSLRREAGAGSALVCTWRGDDDPLPLAPAPAVPSAARLASALARRGLESRACGAVCVVELPAGAAAAAAMFRDAAAAAEVPAVLALARRDPALDPLLAAADRLVLALADGADPALADLALEGLEELGPLASRAPLPAGVFARQAARLGFASAWASATTTTREGAAGALRESLS